MTDGLITDQQSFDELCTHIRDAGLVAFDTEFISENTYRPRLCLVQLATRDRCVAVDPFSVDLTEWWDIMADDQTTVVVHAGREETRFCLTNCGQRPRKLWDIQIAEGLRSSSYPLSYERLISRVLGRALDSSETRTDWQRRPLTARQITYALDDVRYVLAVWDRQTAWLGKHDRRWWAEEEFERMIDDMVSERGDDMWMRLSGIRRLSPRQLAVARELYRWRDAIAESRNQPLRRVLRDDLIIDLARRQPQSEGDLLNSREMNRTNFRRHAGEIVDCVRRALELSREMLPPRFEQDDKGPDEPVIGKLLALALAHRSAELEVSAGLVGTSNDVRMLIRWYGDGCPDSTPPKLTTSWRAQVCGDFLKDVLEGRVSLRVADPNSATPIVFERNDAAAP